MPEVVIPDFDTHDFGGSLTSQLLRRLREHKKCMKL